MVELVLRGDAPRGPTPACSVVVPVLDGGPRLVALVEAVLSQRITGGVEVLLADSGSRDGATDEARRRGPAVRAFDVRGPYNHGLVRSALVRAARGPRVALLSQDSVPRTRHYLRRLGAPLDDPSVAGTFARQVARPGADPLVVATLRRWTPPPEQVPRRRRQLGPGAALDALPPRARIRLAAFDNVGSMVRRERVLEVPFPESDFGEDLRWGAEVLRRGWALIYVPEAVTEHHHDPSLWESLRRDRANHAMLRRRFGLHAVAGPVEVLRALPSGLLEDAHEAGPLWALRGVPRRVGALAGQWAGGRWGAP